jgi:hypothetical protein
MDAQKSCGERVGGDNFVTIEVENEIVNTGALFGVFGEDSKLSFVGGNIEAPGKKPLGYVVD